MVLLAGRRTTSYFYSTDRLAMAVPVVLAVPEVRAALAAKVAAVQFIVVAVTVALKEPAEPRDARETRSLMANRMARNY
jgi:hypothetical protein